MAQSLRDLEVGVVILFNTACLVLAVILISIGWSSRLSKTIGFFILFFVFGFWRSELATPKITEQHLASHNDQAPLTFIAKVAREPDERERETKLTLKAQEEGQGKVLVTVPRYPEYHYGDILKVTCALVTPKEYEDFSYKDYLSRFGIYSICFPREGGVALVSADQGNPVYAAILKLKNRGKETINTILPEPQASLLAAIILGVKRGIPEEIRTQFSQTGISHIIAISGMHIIILSFLVMSFLIKIGLWRQQAFYGAVGFMFFYIILVGAPASAVRAGIMGFLLLLALHIGRLAYSTNAIGLAATVMLIFNPKLLSDDVGFKLSFAATLGIVFVYPILDRILTKMPEMFIGKKLVLLTLSAQVTTLPLILYHFETLSLVAPLTNVLVVPLLPLLMILGLISIIAGFLYWLLGWMLGWLVNILLIYILAISSILSKLPFAYLELEAHWGLLVLYYFSLVILLIWYNRKYSRESLQKQAQI